MPFFRKGQKDAFWVSAAWSVFLCLLALQPKALVLRFFPTESLSSAAHVVVYFAFSLMLARAWGLERRKGLAAAGFLVLIAGTCAFSGALTEYIQKFARGRWCSLEDFRYDMAGTALGAAFYYGIVRGRAVFMGFRAADWAERRHSPIRGTPGLVPVRTSVSLAALFITSGLLFLGLDSTQFLTVYCLAVYF